MPKGTKIAKDVLLYAYIFSWDDSLKGILLSIPPKHRQANKHISYVIAELSMMIIITISKSKISHEKAASRFLGE